MNQRQELFCQGLLQGKTATDAYISAGYAPKQAASAAVRLSRNVSIQTRIAQLNAMTVSNKVMSVIERKERLSEIARARLSDFVECGADGSWINVGLDSLNSAAIQSIKSSTEYDEDGSKPTVITDIKLHPPVSAIAELNKMEGIYSDGPKVNVDNRQVNFIVQSQEEAQKVKELITSIPRRLNGDTPH